jgi:formylglycine-generating enzyme required for sulfatase activity
MVVIPAGSFVMGSPASEPGRFEDAEGPQHTVAIGRSFAISRTPITRAEYEVFARTTRRSHPGGMRKHERRGPLGRHSRSSAGTILDSTRPQSIRSSVSPGMMPARTASG